MAIASEFRWSHDEILELPIVWAFHLAMQAKRLRFQRLEDQRSAACFAHFPERTQKTLLNLYDHMLAGPGLTVRLEQVVSQHEREAMRECEAIVDAQVERFRRLGILCTANGTKPVSSLRGKGTGKRPGDKQRGGKK